MENLTPKEKAKELIMEFNQIQKDKQNFYDIDESIKYALIVVREILKQKPSKPYGYNSTVGYWQEVKQKIINYNKE